MIRYIKTFEVIFSTINLSGMHISTMWHSLNVLKYFCPLSVHYTIIYDLLACFLIFRAHRLIVLYLFQIRHLREQYRVRGSLHGGHWPSGVWLGVLAGW